MNYYRRAYESAIAFGASKSLENKLKLDEAKKQIYELEARLQDALQTSRGGVSVADGDQQEFTGDSSGNNEKMQQIQDYYQTELRKKDLIIKRQRDIIGALSQKSMDQIRLPNSLDHNDHHNHQS